MESFTIEQLRDQLIILDKNKVFLYELKEEVIYFTQILDINGFQIGLKPNTIIDDTRIIKLEVTTEKVYYDSFPYKLDSTYIYYTITLTKTSVRIENGSSGIYGHLRLKNYKSIEQLGKTVMRALLNKENIKDIF